jgi:hypothetical protein
MNPFDNRTAKEKIKQTAKRREAPKALRAFGHPRLNKVESRAQRK